MEVKGTAIVTIPLFVKEKFGPEGFDKWFNALTPEAKEVFRDPILPSSWYNLNTFFHEPIDKICNLFYQGDLRGAWESGRFSADYALKGIYKIFVKLGSIEYLIQKVKTISETY